MINNIMENISQTDVAGYVKKGASIVNIDDRALDSYKKKKEMNRRIRVLENQVEELKKMVQFLMEKQNG